MPELPEVETVRQVLINWVDQATIKDIKCYYSPILENCNINELKSALVNKKVESISRKGKYLIFHFGDYSLISHLRMEGKYYFYKNNNFYSKHIHLVFETDKGYLVYHDTRKFGKFNLVKTSDLYTNSPLTKLGKEPFNCLDNKDDMAFFYNGYLGNKSTIKEALLDQSIICGIGNIYADEICFEIGKLPYQKCTILEKEDVNNIVKSAEIVLNKAIKAGGSSVHSFTFNNDVSGKFQEELNIYGREGQLCHKCGCVITKMTLGGRGTCFCSSCQNKVEISNPRVIGVTGLIASGKSTICEYFKRYNYEILNADEIVKLAYKDYEIVSKVLDLFDMDRLDLDYVRYYINNDKNLRKALEDIIHPYVINYIKEKISDGNKYVLDVPLLFESKLNKVCDFTIFVHTSDRIRIKRLKERNPNYNEYRNLNNDSEEANRKIKLSSYVIDNSIGLDNTNKQLEILCNKLSIK